MDSIPVLASISFQWVRRSWCFSPRSRLNEGLTNQFRVCSTLAGYRQRAVPQSAPFSASPRAIKRRTASSGLPTKEINTQINADRFRLPAIWAGRRM